MDVVQLYSYLLFCLVLRFLWCMLCGSLVTCCLGLCIADLLIVLVLSLPRYNICLWFCYVALRLCGLVG